MKVIYEPKGRAREYSALACNLYTGCGHGCLYCYAPAVLRRNKQDFHGRVEPRFNILKDLKKDCAKIRGSKDRILLCFSCDPYQKGADNSTTRKAIQIIKAHDLSVQILSKGGMDAAVDFDLLDDRDRVAATLTFDGLAESRKWEPNAATPFDRYCYLNKAKGMGLTTWASLEPVIDPAHALRIIYLTQGFVDKYKVGPLNHIKGEKAFDCKEFGFKAVELLESLGKEYYLKNDLRRIMGVE